MPTARIERRMVDARGNFEPSQRVYHFHYHTSAYMDEHFHATANSPQLKIVDVKMVLGRFKWYQGSKNARYVGFFEPGGVAVHEEWNTGDLNVETPSELREYFIMFEREVDEYVRQCGLVRTGLPRID